MTEEPVTDNEFAQVVGVCWSEHKVLTATGVTSQTLAAWRKTGRILGLQTSDGTRLYPVDQFVQRADAVEVRPALLPVLGALRSFDPWAVAVLLHTPAPELDDASPLGWLTDGGAPEVLARLADTVAQEWAAGTPPQGSLGEHYNVATDPVSGLTVVSLGRPVSAVEVAEALDDD
ncbi:hypothetical protein [Nocardioides panaciterrulae]|uniref:Rv2175c C-terminal domain-containing protein n=1 Tax=Nocardioides panaciterrulae TaxID=661492 RepID=A0A7Y9E333_9ACTN|nr:hypothetical protein [Nocardioides panaciterrulae]NYD40037.1 hypothetical protein [Nocardioides panaciterrulae]